MKVKKLFLSCLTILGIGTTQMLHAQSTIPQRELWVIGQNVVNFDGNSGNQTTVNQLPVDNQTILDNNQPLPQDMYVSNAYHDEAGKLLFYIAAGKVYDWEGRFIGGLYEPNSVGFQIQSFKDIAILPDKCDPRVFYIVTSSDPSSPGHSASNYQTVYYIKLEIGFNYNAVNYDLTPNFGGSPLGDPLADGRLGYINSVGVFGGSIPAMTPLFAANNTGQNDGNYTFAVSKKQADGEYLLVATSGIEVAIYKGSDFAAAGNSTPIPLFFNLQFGNQNGNIETEIFQFQQSNLDILRVANISSTLNKLYYQDFEYAAGVINSSPPVLLNDILNNASDFYSGLEFSKSGNYLYFTATNQSNIYPFPLTSRLSYFDLTQPNLGSQNITTSQLNYSIFNNFCVSQIELGKDDALYFCSGAQLGRLNNTDNPTSIIPSDFTAINLPIAYQRPNNVTFDWPYPMNDQVDG